jgi:flagellar protein FlgJ
VNPSDDAARLRKAAAEVEGVFMQQLFKAMRETVPADGLFDGGSGESMFTEMLDAQVADAAASRQKHGLGEALYRQLSRALALPAEPVAPSTEINPSQGGSGS